MQRSDYSPPWLLNYIAGLVQYVMSAWSNYHHSGGKELALESESQGYDWAGRVVLRLEVGARWISNSTAMQPGWKRGADIHNWYDVAFDWVIKTVPKGWYSRYWTGSCFGARGYAIVLLPGWVNPPSPLREMRMAIYWFVTFTSDCVSSQRTQYITYMT